MAAISSSHKVIKAETVAGAVAVNSESLYIGHAKAVSVSFQIASGTAPSVKIEVQQSIDGSNWSIPEALTLESSTIDLDAVTDTDLHMFKVNAFAGNYMRLVVTGNGSNSADTILTAWINLREEA